MSDPDFQQSLQQMRPTLLRFAMLQLRNEAAAEDVVQETLLAAPEGKSAFSGRSQFKTWAVPFRATRLSTICTGVRARGRYRRSTSRVMKTSTRCSTAQRTLAGAGGVCGDRAIASFSALVDGEIDHGRAVKDTPGTCFKLPSP